MSPAETTQVIGHPAICGSVDGATVASFEVDVGDGVQGVRLERVDDTGSTVVDARRVDSQPFTVADHAVDASGAHDYVITVIDFAGNESEPTVVSADLGCPGTCASTSSAPFGALALALLALRRRRRA